ncbi:MAG: C25 family cysteine peptidase [Chloroflexota bacterium]
MSRKRYFYYTIYISFSIALFGWLVILGMQSHDVSAMQQSTLDSIQSLKATEATEEDELSAPNSELESNPSTLADSVVIDSVSSIMPSSPITPTFWVPPLNAYRIYVTDDGIQALDYSGLANAGLPVESLDPRTFRMFFMGQEMAIRVTGEADGRFDPEDVILFYGRSVDSYYFDDQLPDHRYTGENIYWLSYGDGSGQRMAEKSSNIAGTQAGPFLRHLHWEEQKRYESRYPRYPGSTRFQADDDRWFWYKLQIIGTPGDKSQRITIPLDDVASGSYTATVQAHLVGALDNMHGARLTMNDTVLFEDATSWEDYAPFTAQANFAQDILFSGNNNLSITVFNIDEFISEVYIDWVKISYYSELVAQDNLLTFDGKTEPGPWRYTVTGFGDNGIEIYDVTDPHQVHQMAGIAVAGPGPYAVEFGDAEVNRRYVAVASSGWQRPQRIEKARYPSTFVAQRTRTDLVRRSLSVMDGNADLLDTSNGADWIAITHRDFWTATVPLADYRSTTMRVAMVDVQRIYDQFNGGLMSAESIRDFLAYAHANWTSPAPQYVLLVGGGTSDARPYLSNSKPTYVPAFMYPADPILGDTAADNRYVTFIGNDILPDMDLGRIPAYSANEVSIVVSKTIHYETTPTFNDWNTNILLIADDLEGGGGDFYAFSDTIAHGHADANDPEGTTFLPAPYEANKVYLGRTCDTNNPSVANECRDEISEAINDQGALFVSYVGHAQTKNWAIERLMDLSLANSFTNMDKLSIFLAMACFEGFYHTPAQGNRSLGETYIFNPTGGAVASWSPTGFGVATGHDWLEQGLFLSVFQDGETRLGTAMTQGKIFMDENAPAGKYDDLVDTFNLFGDPALVVQAYLAPTAVDVSGLTARIQNDRIVVEWSTANESQILGFHLLRNSGAVSAFERITEEPIVADFVGTAGGSSYQFTDTQMPANSYQYRLEILHTDGSSSQYGWATVNTGSGSTTVPEPEQGPEPMENRIYLPTVVK